LISRVERDGHENFVVVATVLLQGVDFMSVRDKSATAIELLRRFVLFDDGQLNQLDVLTRMSENRFDKRFRDTGTARAGANVHAPQKALVSPLVSGLRAVAGHA